MHRFSGILLLSTLLTLSTSPASATDEDYESIPHSLRNSLHPDLNVEDYVSSILKPIRDYGEGQIVLTQKIVKEREIKLLSQHRAKTIARILAADLNNDGEVTLEEAQTFIALGEGERNPEGRLLELMSKDYDNNKVVDYNEMRDVGRRVPPPFGETFEYLLALSPERNERITIEQLEKIARSAFAAVDQNDDGYISPEELRAYHVWFQRITFVQPRPEKCEFPEVSEEDLIVHAVAAEGAAVSSVTTSTQHEDVTATTLTIEKGDSPLYLVLSSHAGLIWQLEGETDRVSKVVLMTEKKTADGINLSGVTGVAKDKVTFILPTSCFGAVTAPDSIKAIQAATAIKKATGKEVHKTIGGYELFQMNVPSGEMIIPPRRGGVTIFTNGGSLIKMDHPVNDLVCDPREKWVKYPAIETPAGFEKQSWNYALTFHPNGIADIDPETVVAQGEVTPYDILPNQMGLSQLTAAGFLERISNREYKIIKPVPVFPANLNGSASTNFVLGIGVPLPFYKKNEMPDCIISEETGHPFSYANSCY